MHNKGILLYRCARALIPGGTQLLSKRPEMFLPGQWPAYYRRCKGIAVWDLDNRKYLDFSIAGVGACPLGYGDPDVDRAVIAAVKAGNMCTLNPPEEVELAQILCRMHPWAERVRFARTGGEAMAIAIRIARASTKKEKILFCGYHGWHDWYLSANLAQRSALDGQLLPGLEPLGVARGLTGSSVPFEYNNLQKFKQIFSKHAKEIAAVVMEPVRSVWPEKGFLETIRQMTKESKVPLVFDEVTSGWRMCPGGIHRILSIEPDICVFAKALGNGYPIAAIIGRQKIMQAAQRSFISSTFWTDKIGPAAALATIRKFNSGKVHLHLIKTGAFMQNGLRALFAKYGLVLRISGIYPLTHWSIDVPASARIHTILNREMLAKGYLISKSFYATLAHKESHLKSYFRDFDPVLKKISKFAFLPDSKLKKFFPGENIHSGFKRLV